MSKLSRVEASEGKKARAAFILRVVERIIRNEGLETLFMSRLVQETYFAKRTLDLYFTTSHEILALLFVQMSTAWHQWLGVSLTRARKYDEFCPTKIQELTFDPTLIPMLVLERRDLEKGLPDEPDAQDSLALLEMLGEQAKEFKEVLDLTDQLASNLVWAVYSGSAGGRQSFRNFQICGHPCPLGCAIFKKRYG
jgi:hypothetical protein